MPEHDIIQGRFKDSGGGGVVYVFPWCAGSVSCSGSVRLLGRSVQHSVLEYMSGALIPALVIGQRRNDSARRHTAKIRGGMGRASLAPPLVRLLHPPPSVGVLLCDCTSLLVGVSPHHVFSCTLLLFVVAVDGYTLATIPSLSVALLYARSNDHASFRAVVAHARRLAYTSVLRITLTDGN